MRFAINTHAASSRQTKSSQIIKNSEENLWMLRIKKFSIAIANQVKNIIDFVLLSKCHPFAAVQLYVFKKTRLLIRSGKNVDLSTWIDRHKFVHLFKEEATNAPCIYLQDWKKVFFSFVFLFSFNFFLCWALHRKVLMKRKSTNRQQQTKTSNRSYALHVFVLFWRRRRYSNFAAFSVFDLVITPKKPNRLMYTVQCTCRKSCINVKIISTVQIGTKNELNSKCRFH